MRLRNQKIIVFHSFKKIVPIVVSLLVIFIFSTLTNYLSPEENYNKIKYSDYQSPSDLFINLDKEMIRQKADWIESIFDRLHRKVGFNGAIVYAEKGRLVYKGAFGSSDFKSKKAVTTKTPFQLASVSKMYTATAIMILREKNQLGFDDPVAKYIPDFPYKDVTIRHLLNHRSGIIRYMSLAHDKWKNKNISLTNDDMLALYSEYKPDPYFTADNGFHYCNSNYAILASIIEKISGLSYGSFLKMNIFRPLGMSNSFVYQLEREQEVPSYIPVGATGYRYRGWRKIAVRDNYLNGVVGDKGVYSSIEDMFKFDQALYNETLVKNEILQEAYTPGSPRSWKRRDNYGFGWRIRSYEDSCVYHYGWWKGFRSFYIRDMKSEKSIIVLSNTAKGPGSYNFWSIIKNNEKDLGFISKNTYLLY